MQSICIKTQMSGGVLIVSGGVWMVSGWCLDGVWIRSESVWGCINTKSVGNNITSWYSDIASYSGALYCIKRPLCGDVWIVSGGVWMGPECVWG